MDLQLRKQKILVLGLGDTGLSAARWLKRQGAHVRVADSRAAPPQAERLRAEMPDVKLRTGAFNDALFQDVELIVSSPGVPLSEPALASAQARGVQVIGDVELFAHALAQSKSKVLAITGSNGKSTVTSMVGAMCQAAGLNTVVAGNIGLPVLDALTQAEQEVHAGMAAPDVYVLELSSFQLETTHTLNAAAATVLNVSEDHLDRYPGMTQYAAAKARIFQGDGVQILNREDSLSSAMAKSEHTVFTFGLNTPQSDEEWGLLEVNGKIWLAQGELALMPVAELPLAGLHNAANALAALALCRALDLAYAPLLQALREFRGLPHRVEWVADISGVSFYDDSKGTNVGATVAALKGMQQKVVLIAGGDGKGQDFTPLKEAVAERARAVVLIGRDAEKIASAIRGCDVPVVNAVSMQQAVLMGYQQAQPGDAVVLSPACASFDMFRNYAHRAEVFVAAVHALQTQRETG